MKPTTMESKRCLCLVNSLKYSDNDRTMLQVMLDHRTRNDYYETIKRSLPLFMEELVKLGAELPSAEDLKMGTLTPLYLGHLMTKITDIAEGNVYP